MKSPPQAGGGSVVIPDLTRARSEALVLSDMVLVLLDPGFRRDDITPQAAGY